MGTLRTPFAGPLVTVDDVQAALVGPPASRPVLVDVRWSLGAGREANQAAYLEEHLPGAAFLDLESALSGPPAPDGRGGRHPMPARQDLEHGLRDAGVRAGRPVVFYDAGPGLGAARAWWVTAHHGLEGAVLDGGLAAWRAAGLPTASGPVDVPEGDVGLPGGAPGRELLDADGLVRHQAAGGQVLDARPADRYRGENETIDPVAGHVPGAVSLPALSLLGPEGRLLDAEQVVQALTRAGGRTDLPTAVYCGSGVQAAHLALTLEAHGVGPRPAVYAGSWSDWVSDPGRPVER
ncbi:sulfurtransferase [Serinicoccus chungangensis]|uniref:Sulfurtransferase n=1 Tax=Serinicoccus chungangensis TaxID=767452 RepID=A0A0W8I183_9MICO|nr:sulfurtransferase [Serinicoccus chungangensis]KUG51493.1 sulfurtransferase [Serinicoccus chungangensis]